MPGVACVIVTRNRPVLLRRCLEAVLDQTPGPSHILVIDNASGPETVRMLAHFPSVSVIRLDENAGGAGGFAAGISAALATGADYLWLMDDDGRAVGSGCLETLLGRGRWSQCDIVAPLVLDEDVPERLAFPIRIDGRTHFDATTVERHGPVSHFAHLFNGALIRSDVFARIGLPDTRLFIRGDEVEFLYRAQESGMRIVLDPAARFLHPGSTPEVNAILFGLYYAILPSSPVKRFYMFRNRAFIFRRYGMWLFLVADLVRYSWLFLLTRRADLSGFADWVRATITGLRGELNNAPTGG